MSLSKRSLTWAPLVVLLLWIGWQAMQFDPTRRPFLLGDEATYLMAAESLAWDFDLSYSESDHRRFGERWGERPDLILLSTDGGESLTYGKPFFYPLYLAPFLRLAPVRGAGVANALLLAIAALVAAFALERRMPGLGAPLAAIYVFCSVTFGHVFWVQADLFLMTLTVLALALVFRHSGDGSAGGSPRRRWRRSTSLWPWAVAGLLVAVLGISRPQYFALLLPLLFAPTEPSARGARRCLLVAVIAAAASISVLQYASSGAWTAYGAERRGFTHTTGYPGLDFPRQEWGEHIERYGNVSWIRPGALEAELSPSLLLWNSIYVFLGRNIGLVPYFLPLFLPLIVGLGGRRRWPFVAAVGIAMLGFLVLRPFNFYGGAGALANRYFLPLYPLFWFLPSRRFPPLVLVVTVALSLLFLWPLVGGAADFPIVDVERGPFAHYRYATGIPQRWLPHETSQKNLRALGSEDVIHHGLWVRFLNGNVRPVEGGISDLELVDAGPGELLIGSYEGRIAGLLVEVGGSGSDAALTVRRGMRATEVRPGESGELQMGRPSALHRMWWPGAKVHLYRVQLSSSSPLETPLRFRLRPRTADD